jgi:hypothetical protein
MSGERATRNGSGAWTRAAAALLASVLGGALLPACATVDVSFKTVTFEGADRDRAFEVCRQVISNYYAGTEIRVDPAGGRIETDPIEETIGGRAMRQQCYVQVETRDDGTLEIALLARLLELHIEHGDENPVRWLDAGSDVEVEAQLLDEISGRILALEIDAKVVATTIPSAVRPR